MAKKLTVEVDADVSKAKRKVKSLAAEGGVVGSGGGSGASDASAAAAKSIKSLGDSAKQAHVNLTGMTKAFVGIGTSMAMSYAASRMSPGAARDTVEYGASILGGASAGAAAGMAAGPWGAAAGAAVGGVAGGVKTYLGKADEKEKYIKDFNDAEAIFANARAWQQKLRELTKEMNSDEISTIIANLRQSEQTLKGRAMERASEGDYEGANSARRAMGDARARIEQLEGLQRTIANRRVTSPRESLEALDSLARIGGGLGGGDFAKQQLDAQKETVSVLRSIDQKTRSGGATWL